MIDQLVNLIGKIGAPAYPIEMRPLCRAHGVCTYYMIKIEHSNPDEFIALIKREILKDRSRNVTITSSIPKQLTIMWDEKIDEGLGHQFCVKVRRADDDI